MLIYVSARGQVPASGDGLPVVIDSPPAAAEVYVTVSYSPLVYAQPAPPAGVEAIPEAAGWLGPRELAALARDPHTSAETRQLVAWSLRAIGLLRYRREFRFHPRTGQELEFGAGGIAGRAPGQDTQTVYPRLDPAVIGMVHHSEKEEILVARNRMRPGYFSLIAGYVDVGESLEHTFEREVWEETGRRVHKITYWGSQPWPASGSLMVGFSATAAHPDPDPAAATDGELAEIRWVGRDQLLSLPLAAPGSIAHTMMMEWYARGTRR